MNVNPFLDAEAPFPDFAAMTPAAAETALPVLLERARARVDGLERTARPEWDAFVRALDDATHPLMRAWGLIAHMLSVANSEAWREVESKWQGEIIAFSQRVGQSRRFYELARSTPAATPARRRILAKTVQGAELAGVALEGAAKERFNALETACAELGVAFRDEVIDATKAYGLHLTDLAQVEGVPSRILETIRDDAGGWNATIEDAVYVPFMQHCRSRDVREALYRARSTRAPGNTARIARLLAQRRELAALLGYADYAAMSLASKCAPSVAAVNAMLDGLAAAARPAAAREDEELRTFAGLDRLEPWDRTFWAERLREAKYAYSEEELARYFDFPAVLDGLFALARRLFDVKVEAVDGLAPTWHEDVRFFRVKDAASGRTLAHFYLDPYSRPATKSGGAWMNDFATRDVRADGSVRLPLAVLCCNQSRPDAAGRSRMSFREVETLFHEFGHALQHMLTTVDDAGASGLSLVDWDAVEVASQFMENWCADSATLAGFAFDPDTREPIPAALVEKVRAARNFRAGTATMRQLAFARTDLELHGPTVPPDADAVKNRVFDACGVPRLEGDRFLESFGHIFGGGYAAGYYSYKWSEVMSADAFGAFEEAGLADDAAVRRLGRRWRDTVLALGGSEDPMAVFARFRGRAPSPESLLRQQGLLA